jgi:hypothetical protein
VPVTPDDDLDLSLACQKTKPPEHIRRQANRIVTQKKRIQSIFALNLE